MIKLGTGTHVHILNLYINKNISLRFEFNLQLLGINKPVLCRGRLFNESHISNFERTPTFFHYGHMTYSSQSSRINHPDYIVSGTNYKVPRCGTINVEYMY